MPLRNALIVDDSRTSAAVLGKMLSRQGLAWDQIDSGEACLAYLVSTTPDIIFMDHMMPGMDGFQAVKAIKQQAELRHIPIVMYTSRQGELYYGQARALGAIGVLQKPATAEDVLAVLARAREAVGAALSEAPAADESLVASPREPQTPWRAAANQTRGRSAGAPLRLHRALIVDDSRTSAAVLARMLARHELGCDRVGSGEECLTYLASANPDIIFMDHMMPGMDGFAAVRAIKQQTKLRAIPIVMYTSQSGDMYFGQARALGAIGVLKKPVAEQDLQDMLQRLRMEHQADSTGEPSVLGSQSNAVVPLDDSNLGLAGAGAESVVRDDGAALATRAERNRVLQSAQETSGQPVRVSRVGSALRTGAIAVLLLVTVGQGWQFWQRSGPIIDEQALVGALAELGNQSPEYPFGAVPFDQRRYRQLREVVRILSLAQVSADIELRAHVGEFCRVYADASHAVLPAGETPIERCDLIGYEPAEARQLAKVQSSDFQQFVARVNQVDDGIRVHVVPVGTIEPRLPYPPDTQITMAGDWNRIAARNNRVEMRVSLTPWYD